jgi:hypothetical protein
MRQAPQQVHDLLHLSHARSTRAYLVIDGEDTHEFTVLPGTTWDEDTSGTTRRSARLALALSADTLSEDDLRTALMPFGNKVRLRTGIALENGDEWLTDVGTYVLTGTDFQQDGSGNLTLSTSGQDSSSTLRGDPVRPVAIRAGQPTADAIATILTAADPRVRLDVQGQIETKCPTKLVEQNAWGSATDLAESAACELFFDERDHCILRPMDTNTQPVWVFKEGSRATQTQVSASWTSDSVPSGIVAEASNAQLEKPMRVLVWDNDMYSQTYYKGKYGQRVESVQAPNVTTMEQLRQFALHKLRESSRRALNVSLSAIPNPLLQGYDAIVADAPRMGVNDLTLIIERISMPADPSGTMSLTLSNPHGLSPLFPEANN